MRYFLAQLFLCLLLPLAPSADANKIQQEQIVSQGKKHSYYLYVPQAIDAARGAPLLVVLHGSGGTGKPMVERWKGLADSEGFILVGPNSVQTERWNMPDDGPDSLRDLVEALKAKYPVDARRVYLFGHSGGAGFALHMALLESEYFAAVAVHAGALHENELAHAEISARKIPLMMYNGTRDQLVPLWAARKTRDELNRRGFNVQLVELPNRDHFYDEVAAEVNQGAWEFLKKQQLELPPKFQQYDFRR